MTLVPMQECESVGGFIEVYVPSHTDPNTTYMCWVQDPSEVRSVICTCPGYTHRGECSHQQEALELLCGWDEYNRPAERQTDEQRKEHICPRCLGPAVPKMELIDR